MRIRYIYIKEKSVLFSTTRLEMADRIEVGFSLNNRPKQAENKSDGHHSHSYHCYKDIQLKFTSLKLIVKNCFPSIFGVFSMQKKNY